MPPLLADFTHARPCKPFCEKYLTLPAPALGAGDPEFEPFRTSDHLTQKKRLKWRFFCVFCSIFVA